MSNAPITQSNNHTNHSPGAGYKQTEVGVIPEDWVLVPLESIIMNGGLVRGPFGGALKKEFFVNRGYKVYEQRNAIYGTADKGDYFIDGSKFQELERFQVQSGDFIVSCSGTIGSIYQIPNGAPEGVINQALLKISLNVKRADPDFFLAIFRSQSFQERIKDNSHGGAMQNLIGMDVFKKTLFPLPPTLAEQRAIADALSDADALIESLEQLIAKRRAVKQGAMQALLTGKTRLPGFEGEWITAVLGRMGKCYRGVTYNPNLDLMLFDTASTLRLLRSNNVQEGRIVFSGIQYVNSSCVSFDQRLRPDDILICMANGSRELVGKAGRFTDGDSFSYTFGAFMGCFRPEIYTADPSFVFRLFQTAEYRAHIDLLLAGSSINNLSPVNVESLVVKIPLDKTEQTAIASVLSDMDAEIAALEAKLGKARQVKQGMMQELLTGRTRLV